MMRTIVLFILLALDMAVYANTGSYRPFVKEGKTWKCTYWTGNDVERNENYTIKGDTVINGISCKKMFRWSAFQYGIFEQDGKVFTIGGGPNPNKERLLFDFSLSLGEYVFNSGGYGTFKVTVLQIDTIVNSQNQPFRRMLVRTGPLNDEGNYMEKPEYLELYWVEGVGSVRGPDDSYFWFNGSQPGRRMDACYEDGECIMTYSEMITEGTSGVNSATATQPQASFIYDLQGRRLKEQPRKGLYIQNGRKVVVK